MRPRIRALIDDQAKAIRAKDVNGSVSGYAPDVLVFDVVNPLQRSRSGGGEKAPGGVVLFVPGPDRLRASRSQHHDRR